MYFSGELFIRPYIQRPHLGTTCYFFCLAFSTKVCTVIIFPSLSPPIVKFRPYFVHFEPSNFYGAFPASAAYLAGPLCLACQPQTARSRLIVARWILVSALAVDLTILIGWTIYLPLAVRDIVSACIVACNCCGGHHSHIFIYLFICSTNVAKQAIPTIILVSAWWWMMVGALLPSMATLSSGWMVFLVENTMAHAGATYPFLSVAFSTIAGIQKHGL
jgi:hypothetical protein